MFLRHGCDPYPITTLSSTLSRLSSLRHLLLEGHDSAAVDVATSHTADCHAASACLAAAVGALTGLQSLELSELRRFLSHHDCHHHLRGLTGLTHLDLSYLVPDAGGSGAALVAMLSGMIQLQRLALFGEHCCAHIIHHLSTDGVPALLMLETLVLPDGIRHGTCMLLARNVRDGLLPHLQRVGVRQTDAQLAKLNSCAVRNVFRRPVDILQYLQNLQ